MGDVWQRRDAALVRDDVEPAKAKLSGWGQGEMFHCYLSGSVMIVGPSRKEIFLSSRDVLEQASFGELDRVVDVVGHGDVSGLVHVAGQRGLGLAVSQPTFASN